MNDSKDSLWELYRNPTGIDQILYDLGGRDFMVMTGCHDFFYDSNKDDPWLRMEIPRNRGNVNRLEITLLSDDTYKLEFYKIKKTKIVIEDPVSNKIIYENLKGHQIRDAFMATTGLEVILPEIIRNNISEHLKNEGELTKLPKDKGLKL